MRPLLIPALAIGFIEAGCLGNSTPANDNAPDAPRTASSRTSDAGGVGGAGDASSSTGGQGGDAGRGGAAGAATGAAGGMPGGTAGNIGGMSSTAGAAGYGAGAPIPIPASLRVMPLGDSLTAGQYDDGAYDIDGGYRGPLRAMLLGATFVGSVGGVHEGHPGYGTKRLADGLPGWLASARPDVVLLMIGTNDLGWTEESTAVATEMTYIVGPALAAGARVFVATLIPTGATDRDIQARRVNYNALLTSAVRAHPEYGKRLHLVDAMAMALALGTTDYRASSVVQVHPEALGYRKMAQVWASAMAAAQ